MTQAIIKSTIINIVESSIEKTAVSLHINGTTHSSTIGGTFIKTTGIVEITTADGICVKMNTGINANHQLLQYLHALIIITITE